MKASLDSSADGGSWRQESSLARSPKISELVARELAARILDEELAEGTQLPNERELIEIFGVGRTTLREALRLLETRGLITIRTGPGGGPVVRRPRYQDLSDSLSLILQIEGAALSDVLEARAVAEPALARAAAVHITDAELSELDASLAAMEAVIEDPVAFLSENVRFHTLIGEAAKSLALQVFLRSLENIVRSIAASVDYSTRQREHLMEGHRQIVAGLRARDPEAAADGMHEHLSVVREFWERKYGHLLTSNIQWS